jgi:tubulin polyglutamylase TTLL9
MVRYFSDLQTSVIDSCSCLFGGYDVIIDEDLKPWLLEVNASPSLTANTKEDYAMKTEMLHGMLDVVDMEGVLQVRRRGSDAQIVLLLMDVMTG